MIERNDFRVLLGYPNLSMMLTPSYAIGLFTAILKEQKYDVDLFDCTPYMPTYEFVGQKENEELKGKGKHKMKEMIERKAKNIEENKRSKK